MSIDTERFNGLACLPGDDEKKDLAVCGDKKIWARHIRGSDYEQTFFSVRIGHANVFALTIGARDETNGSSDTTIGIGVIPLDDESVLHNYSWSTSDGGTLDHTGSMGGSYEKDKTHYEDLKRGGFPTVKKLSDLPRKIDVRRAVDHWFSQIKTMVQQPDKLQELNLSVQNLVGQFAVA